MATKSFRQNGETSRSKSSVNGPQFIKIFSRELTTMRIPVEFVKRYGKNLPKMATFEVPTGEEWKIELVHSNGRIWLGKGWEEFTKNYSIKYGHLLVFKYDGKSRFHVLIFDMSASEIEYPQIVSHDDDDEDDDDEDEDEDEDEDDDDEEDDDDDDDDDDVEILNQFPNKRKRQEDQKHDSDHQPKKTTFATNRVKVENISEDDGGPPSLMTPRINSETNRVKVENISEDDGCPPSLMTPKINSPTTYQRMVKKDTSTAYQRAKAFKSKNPFHISIMYPSYVSPSNRLTIPLGFAKKHFPSEYNDLVLVSSGKSWSARYTLNSQHARIYGWNAFVVDNKIKVGDVCILEMVKSKKLTLNVIIFHAND